MSRETAALIQLEHQKRKACVEFVGFLGSHRAAAVALLTFTFLYTVEQYDRYVLSVAEIPYLQYDSYAYSLLSGPIFAVVYAVAGIVFAIMEDVRTDRVVVLCASCFVWSVALGLTAVSTQFWHVALIRLVMGLAQSTVAPFSSGIIECHFPPEFRGIVFGGFNVAVYVGYAASLSLGTFLYDQFPWTTGYWVAGGVGILVALIVWMLNEDPTIESRRNAETAATAAALTAAVMVDDDGHEEDDLFSRDDGETVYFGTPATLSHNAGAIADDRTHDDTHDNQFAFYSSLHDDGNGTALLKDGGNMDDEEGGNRNGDRHDNNNYDADDDDDDDDEDEDEDEDEDDEGEYAEEEESFRTGAPTRRRKKDPRLLLQRTWAYWRKHPALFMLCLASGARFGAGYIWAYYTAVFFSDRFEDSDTHCSTSYNATYPHHQKCDDDFPYCHDGYCADLHPYPWHNEGLSSEKLESYMSWIPLVGSALGAVLGGHISDLLSVSRGPIARVFVAAVSSLLAMPLVGLSFFLDFPGCFLIFIGSGLIGEMYIGIVLAVLTDLVPRKFVVTSTSLYLFAITLLGGSAPILVPVFTSFFGGHHVYTFHAAPAKGSPEDLAGDNKAEFTVRQTSSNSLQYALLVLIPGLYALSAFLFLATMLFLRDPSYARVSRASKRGAGGASRGGRGNNLIKQRNMGAGAVDEEEDEEGDEHMGSIRFDSGGDASEMLTGNTTAAAQPAASIN